MKITIEGKEYTIEFGKTLDINKVIDLCKGDHISIEKMIINSNMPQLNYSEEFALYAKDNRLRLAQEEPGRPFKNLRPIKDYDFGKNYSILLQKSGFLALLEISFKSKMS